MAPRFLGWRRKENPSLTPLADADREFAPVLPAASCADTSWISLAPTPRDRDAKQRERAVWSDDSSFGNSDGFNLAKWRAECAVELEAAAARKRWVKPTAKPRQLSPSSLGEQFTATFLQGACTESNSIQRGPSDFVKTTKQLSDKEKALRMRQNEAEVSKQNRRLAAQWREQKEQVFRHGEETAQQETRRTSKGTSSKRNLTEEEHDERRERAVKVIERIQSNNVLKEARIRALTLRAFPKPASFLERTASKKMEDEELDQAHKVVRSRIKKAVTVNLEKRARHARKTMRHHRRWKDHLASIVLALPDASRQIAKDAFSLYARAGKDGGEMVMQCSDIRKALAFVGVNGNSGRERIAVERACAEATRRIFKQYARLEFNLSMEDDSGELGDGESHLLNVEAMPYNAGHTEHLIDFEEFCGEVVADARKALSHVRQDLHFSKFMAALREQDSESVFLGVCKFKRLALQLDMDYVSVKNASKTLLARSKIRSSTGSSRSLSAQAIPLQDYWQAHAKAESTPLDFEKTHNLLMDLQEQSRHLMHKRELEIKAKQKLSDEVFWQYEGELVRLHDTFFLHDTNRCENLDFTDVKQLLHHLGFQPHRPRESEAVDLLLCQCDIDLSETVSFHEFLDIVDKVRMQQRGVREAKLRHEFGRHIKIDRGYSTDQKMSSTERQQELTVDVAKVQEMFYSAGLRSGKSATEKELVDLTINSSCENDIGFTAFEELCQLICETLNREEVQEQHAEAEFLGIAPELLYLYQGAFESARCRELPSVNLRDIPKVLGQVLARIPPKEELDERMWELSKSTGSNEVSFSNFLQFLSAFVPFEPAPSSKDRPFTLTSVSEKKLKQILQLFPVSSDYIATVSSSELPEVVATFLGVQSHTNLREHKQPMCNIRQLMMYAQKRAPMHHVFRTTEDLTQSMASAVNAIDLHGGMTRVD